MEHINRGKLGEDIAVSYLMKQGYCIISRNYRVGHKEIDIIAGKEQAIHFIEVKTSSRGNKLTLPEDRLSRKKIRLLKKAIREYCLILDIKQDLVSLDAIAIILDYSKKLANIKHFLNIS